MTPPWGKNHKFCQILAFRAPVHTPSPITHKCGTSQWTMAYSNMPNLPWLDIMSSMVANETFNFRGSCSYLSFTNPGQIWQRTHGALLHAKLYCFHKLYHRKVWLTKNNFSTTRRRAQSQLRHTCYDDKRRPIPFLHLHKGGTENLGNCTIEAKPV